MMRPRGHVYLIGNTQLNYYKIGIAWDIVRRMADFSLPFEIELLAYITLPTATKARDIEQGLHAHFSANHLRGEWFRDITKDQFISAAEDLSTKSLSKVSWRHS